MRCNSHFPPERAFRKQRLARALKRAAISTLLAVVLLIPAVWFYFAQLDSLIERFQQRPTGMRETGSSLPTVLNGGRAWRGINVEDRPATQSARP